MSNFSDTDIFLVTGASSGLGKAIALHLNSCGATVIGIGRDMERLSALKSEAAFSQNMHIENIDLSTEIEKLPNFIKNLKNKYGKFKGMVCAAGTAEIIPLRSTDFSSLQSLFLINYFVPMVMAQAFADKRNNIGQGAAIIFISSFAARLNNKGMLAYCGSKSALNASARCIAKELAPQGIRVNTISPADIETPLTKKLNTMREDRKELYPLGEGTPQDVANLTAFLLSDEARWITGEDYAISGGINE